MKKFLAVGVVWLGLVGCGQTSDRAETPAQPCPEEVTTQIGTTAVTIHADAQDTVRVGPAGCGNPQPTVK